MVVCSSGSRIKATTPEVLVITQPYFEALLPVQLEWLRPFLPYVRPIVLPAVTDFCSQEPPGWPDLTGISFAAVFAGGQVGAGLIVAGVIEQILLNCLWYQLCECISGGTPALPSAPTAPVDLPQLNPPAYVSPPSAQSCAHYESLGAALVSGKSDIGMGDEYPTVVDVLLPAGAKFMQFTFTNNASGSTHGSITWFINIKNGPSTYLTSTTRVVASGATLTETIPVPAAAIGWNVQPTQTTGGPVPSDTATTVVDYFCAGYPGSTAAPCCPPDPILSGLLSQILELTTLVQRQAAPFAYVYGANHTGLTANGTIAVQGLIGVSVDVTTLPGSYGRAEGEPVELFDIGWVTLGTADGYEQSRRIDSEGVLFLPPAAGAFTKIGYTLAAGVEASVRELVREP